MATIIVSTNIAGDVKPTFASSAVVGLTVRANGEENVKVLDAGGNMVDSNIPAYNDVAHAPIMSSTGTPGVLPDDKFAAYLYVYAATTAYPFVENDVAIGGSVAPRGNPNRQASIQISSDGRAVLLQGIHDARPDIDQLWFFRTAFFSSGAEASNNAIAGNAFYVGSVPNIPAQAGLPTAVLVDANEAGGTDQVEYDNQLPAQFRYVIYSDPYWWGWGNDPFVAKANWTTGGALTLLGGRKWFIGRSFQYVKLEGITTGGIDGHGTFLFAYDSATAGHVIDAEFTPLSIPSAGSNKAIVIQGPSTTLYRSKPRNPFSWGMTEIFGTAHIPVQFAIRVGGGQGTGIAVIPNLPYLLLSTEFPAGSYVLDLRQADGDGFIKTLRKISDFYSISSHFSQFPATRADKSVVLWGWDAKNYCVLECNGVAIYPVSDPISKTLRSMSSIRSRQHLAHGAYDSRNSLNCIWLPTANSISLVNLLVAQHAPSQQWFIHDDHDVLCSTQLQDGDTNLSKIFLGTQTGFVGEAFVEGKYADWITDATKAFGNVVSATSTSITAVVGTILDSAEEAYVGSWCLITDQYGEHEQWARISSCNVATRVITFDAVYSELGGSGTAFNPVPAAGWRFYIGLIEVRSRKYFDLNSPSTDKELMEIWLTLEEVERSSPLKLAGDGSTFLRYYRDRFNTPYSPLSSGKLNVPLKIVTYDGAGDSQAWFTQEPPSDEIKTFGIEIIDRAYRAWKMYNWTLKME